MQPHTIERKRQIDELYAQGVPRTEVARKLGLTVHQVDYVRMGERRREKKAKYKLLDSGRETYVYFNARLTAWWGRWTQKTGKKPTVEEALARIGTSPTCYLTGAPIDLRLPGTYQLDHIIPLSIGGTSNLDNLGITTPEANQMKDALPLGRFIELCKVIAFRQEQGYIKIA